MSNNRRRNATKCRTPRCDRRTHHRTAICSLCRDIPSVQKQADGVVLLGQIRLTETQALQLAAAIADALTETKT